MLGVEEHAGRGPRRRMRARRAGLAALLTLVALTGAPGATSAESSNCQPQTAALAPLGFDLEDRPVSNLGVFCEDILPESTVSGEFVHHPIDGRSSARCKILAASSYDNVHCFTNLADLPFTPPLVFRVDFKLPAGSCNNDNDPPPSLVQAIEFSMSRYVGGRRWEWALQLQNVGSGAPQWRVWLPEDSSWLPISVPVAPALCAGGAWHTFEMRGRIASGLIRFDSFSIDDVVQPATIDDLASVERANEPDRFAAAVQIDSNASGTSYRVHLDHLSLTPANQVFGLDFGPYVDGQSPDQRTQISEEQLRERMELVSPYTRWIRSFGCGDGLERTGKVAHELGLRAALGAWIGRDAAENELQLQCLIARVNAGEADLAIVGSEALLRNDVPAATLVAAIERVKSETAASLVPVATADVYSRLLANPAVMSASDWLLPNIYGYWEGVAVDRAVWMLDSRYRQLQAAAPGKRIVVSETGWPSCGAVHGEAVPSVENAARYFFEFMSWTRRESIDAFYFEGLDETWKASSPEGAVGACWGIADKLGVLKAGMQRGFEDPVGDCTWCGETAPGGPGPPLLEFTRVPPFGSHLPLKGRELHAVPDDFYVAVYIRVGGGWWTKPTFAAPRTALAPDGRWSANVVTDPVGNDALATDYSAFLLPNTFAPPAVGGASSLPAALAEHAVASATVSRTASSPVATSATSRSAR